MQRQAQIQKWLSGTVGFTDCKLEVASADASFRRYFRVKQGDKSYVVMDAPPDKEPLEPFAGLSSHMRKLGVNTPKIYARNNDDGFLLLTDLGKISYLDKLNDDNADILYKDAISALLKLQQQDRLPADLPLYDEKLLLSEMNLFTDWYLRRHLNMQVDNKKLDNIFHQLAKVALEQPQVFVHRDYHSRNLMFESHNNPGIIDFQDAVCGPLTYDMVSLLRDCYISWPDEKINDWLEFYHARTCQISKLSAIKFDQLKYWFDWMGVQRHLKAVGIFARLNYRDGKPGYMLDIPRTLGYIQKISRQYKELAPLEDYCLFTNDSITI